MRPPLPASLAALALLTAAPALAAPLHTEGAWFRDEAGRAVILRGVNVAGDSKVPPFTASHDPAIYPPLARFGFNVVRLLFTWEAYEPAQGGYDEAYLDGYVSAVKAAWESGLYVIVDFHQDAFSRGSIGGCGDGFPLWAIPPGVTPAAPDNGPSCADWGTKMQGDADMLASWSAFYADTHGVRTRYLAMLERVSERLASEPGVIGYDPLNEPWGDEVTEIGPLYEDAAQAIRKASPGAIVFVSPRALTSAGLPTELAQPTFDNAAYSPHFYDASVLLFGAWSGFAPTDAFALMSGTATSWDVPLFLGEFGSPGPTLNGDAYIAVMYRTLDEGLWSSAQWSYTPGWTEATKDGWNAEDLSIVDDQGALRSNFRVRPALRAVSGTPTLFRWNDKGDGTVEVAWDHDPSRGATEIFLPVEDLFGQGGAAITAKEQDLSCALAGHYAICTSSAPGAKHVTFSKASPAPPPPSGCAVGHDPGSSGVWIFAVSLIALAGRARGRRRT